MEIMRFEEMEIYPEIVHSGHDVRRGYDWTGPDRHRQNGGLWNSAASEGRSGKPQTAGNYSVSHQRACDPGGGGASESG